MGLQVYKISDYDHIAETQQFEAIINKLESIYSEWPEECILIGNYNIEGVELDALLIAPGGIRILEFKNWGGQITARENGSWTSDGLIIEGGSGRKTPYEQIRINKSRVFKGLSKYFDIQPQFISAAIIFWKDAVIDTTQLSNTVKTWLRVCDNSHLSLIIEGLDKTLIPDDLIEKLPEKLRIEEFLLNKEKDQSVTTNEIYEPEAPTNFFEELELAIQERPNFMKVYNAMNQTFKKCLNQKLSQNRINFGGDFAKTDFLLKEYGAQARLIKNTNDTRVRLRKRHDMSELDFQKYCLYDFKNLCQFISYIYKIEIPKQLITFFPPDKEPETKHTLLADYLRVIVHMWDDKMIYVQTEDSADGDLKTVCYTEGNTAYDYDWSYLKNLFYKDAQLNLIRPKETDGVIYPELIIFEPDYLVNISTVAHCFTNYADSPFVDLIKKLEPPVNNEAILLGNLASQLLDETIHQLPNTHSYNDSVKDFYKDNAISLLTAKISPEFHSNAQAQKYNIAQAIQNKLSERIGQFNSKDGILEPSFFSEMLGLQGRMDYLKMDFKVLIEQKSGKGAFPYDNFIRPRQTDEHYVQILLYMALIRYNYSEIYKKNHGLRAFLLYSKYQESLLGLGFAPELIFKAIKIRNGLAWNELLFTKPNGYKILDELTPDIINSKNVFNNLWTNYQLPQIINILGPIQKATELEKAYYFRFLTFIANEHVMSKLGNKTKESSGFAATWYDSLEEKRQAGNIYDQLTLITPNNNTDERVDTIELKFSDTEDNDMSNFRVGDIVILYPYTEGKEPDARKTIVLRCTIEDIQLNKIILVLRAKQSDGRFFIKHQNSFWAIEHDFMESSYSSLYKGMQAFLTAPKERRDLLLLQREPEINEEIIKLNDEYGEYNETILKVKRAKDLFLLIGPPGTGKTSFGLLYTVKEELTNPNSSVLLLSYTNRAVDEICNKLKQEGIDFIRIGGALSCSNEFKDNLISSRVQKIERVSDLKNMLVSVRVFVGTTTALNSNISLFQLKQFDLAVVDEASQILEPHLIGLLSTQINGTLAIKKFVLIGDHKQLPAVVQQNENESIVHDIILNDICLKDCRLSLFERLLEKYEKNRNITDMLTKQGRMHHDIALFPNYTFYNNLLVEAQNTRQTKPLPFKPKGNNGISDILDTRRIAFIAAEMPEQTLSDKVNQTEADMIAAIVVKIYEREYNNFNPDTTIGVIVPYRNQITTIRKAIDKYGIKNLHDITIDTVERFQGSQRKYVIYGFTIQKYYQLKFLTNNVFVDSDGNIVDRKLNVAITRAEDHLLLIGNPELLSNNFTFFKLIEFAKSRHSFFRIGKNDFINGNFIIPEYDAQALDLSSATYTMSERYEKAYTKYVLQPVKEASRDEWPSKVFGSDMATNLNAIGYGRISFSNQLNLFNDMQLSPERQVLIYCYYIMRQHYCSSKNLYTSFKDWINEEISSVNGRVHMIDIGCGPATCGVAFCEVFKDEAPNMVYTGIDVSTEMKRMGKNILDDVSEGKLHYQMIDSFNMLSTSFWNGCSELPSLIIINMSYFFSNVSAQFTEQLALQISSIMRKYPLNKYIFIVQHSDTDKKLNSFNVFKQILEPFINIIKSEDSSFSYTLNYKEKNIPFCYDIFSTILPK